MMARHSVWMKLLLLALLVGPSSGEAAQGRAYDVSFVPNTLINGGTPVVLGSVAVPAGFYVAFARLQVLTGSTAPGNSFRLDCDLLPDGESVVYRVGQETNAERYVTLNGAVTLDSAGSIRIACRDGNGHTDTVLSGKLTVIGVSTIN